MTFSAVDNTSNPCISSIQNLYEDTFPLSERRRWEDVELMLGQPGMHLEVVTGSNDEFIGFIVWWKLGEYLYIEHLAIEASQRRKDYGSRIMRHFIERSCGYLVLETELPLLEDAAQRIGFYESLGLKKVIFPYAQPPYRLKGSPVPMQLMTLKPVTDKTEFDKLVKLIEKEVYVKFW